VVCSVEEEALFHFMAEFPHKWTYWERILDIMNPLSVWAVLSSFSDSSGSRIERELLCKLDDRLATLWKYHWFCFFENAD
jgi:hypothetical protein